MRQYINKLEVGETQNIHGDVLKIKVRDASQDLEIRTQKGDVFPVRTGDFVALPNKTNGITVKNLGDSEASFDFILMDGKGAEYESSAGAVEIVNDIRLKPQGLNRFINTLNFSFYGDVNEKIQVMAENPSRTKAIVIIKQITSIGEILVTVSEQAALNSEAGKSGQVYEGTFEDEGINAMYMSFLDAENTGAWDSNGEHIARITVIEYAEYYVPLNLGAG
jgi:hypothetical protein